MSLRRHIQALHPNVCASTSQNLLDNKDFQSMRNQSRSDRSEEISNDDSTNSNVNMVVKEGADRCAGLEISNEGGCLGEVAEFDNSVKDTKGVVVDDTPVVSTYDTVDNVFCRMKFEMRIGERVIKKTIKTLMQKPVQKAIKKFTKHVDKDFDDLKFKSNDCDLSGEELAGSIARGLIKVSLISSDDHKVDDLEVSKDLITAADFEEIRRDWFNRSARFSPSSSDQDICYLNEEVNQDSIIISESATVDDTEYNMETDIDLESNTEHVVDFSKF